MTPRSFRNGRQGSESSRVSKAIDVSRDGPKVRDGTTGDASADARPSIQKSEASSSGVNSLLLVAELLGLVAPLQAVGDGDRREDDEEDDRDRRNLAKRLPRPAISAALTTVGLSLSQLLELVGVELVAGDDDLRSQIGRAVRSRSRCRRCYPSRGKITATARFPTQPISPSKKAPPLGNRSAVTPSIVGQK